MKLTEEQIAINRLMCGNTAHSCKADYINTAIQALEQIQQYRAIGTVEEFKVLKEEVELYRNLDKTNFSDGYAKAIDEFAEKLNNSIDMLDLNYEYRCDGGVQHQTLNNMREIIQELSEQIKAGGNNE